MYRTVNFNRSAISKLHMGFGNNPIGQHPLIKQVVRAVFRLRPPLPRYKVTFDIKPALTYMKQILGNNNILNVKLLTYKCLFLIAFHSFSRVSTMSKLGSGIEEHQGHIIVPLLSAEKQARGHTHYLILSKYLSINAFQLRTLTECVATSVYLPFPRKAPSVLPSP